MLALILLQNSFSLWGHHLPRRLNFIADKLSPSSDLSFSEMITNIVHSCKSHNFNPPSPIFFLETTLSTWALDLFDLAITDARAAATTGTTRAKITVWRRWTEFCSALNIRDLDLIFLSTIDKYRTACSFVTYCRRSRLRKGAITTLGVDAVRKILQDVGEVLSLHGLMEGFNPFINKKL